MMSGMRLIRRFIYSTWLVLRANVRDLFDLDKLAERKRKAAERWP